MGYVLTSLSEAGSNTGALVVQTDSLAPVTVTTADELSQEFGAISVTSKADGSFDVFWSVFSTAIGPGGTLFGPATEYEQVYSASGEAIGSATAISATSSTTQSFLSAAATASGGYVLASKLPDTTNDTETLVVQTDKLAPVNVDTVGSDEVGTASVTSNADGSFDVFWSVFSTTIGPGGALFGPATEYEQVYSASGDAIGSATAISTASSATQSFLAATATASGGYVLASQLGDSAGEPETLVVQTDKLAPITVSSTNTDGDAQEFGATSVTSNADGSFDIFWSIVTIADASRGFSITATEYEQTYSSSGEALSSSMAISTTPPAPLSNRQDFLAATGTNPASGGTTPPPVTSDLVLQNRITGQASIWEMDGTNLVGGGPVSPNPGPNWTEVGTCDFNKDGNADLLWQNQNTGQVSVWEMNGSALIGGGPVIPVPGTAWQAVGTGDFNNDGDSDIVFQNKSTGQVSIWEMNGNTLTGGGPVSPNPGPAWKAVGTGDFNHDGVSDLLFQNKTTGKVSIWEMNGNTLIGGGPVSPNPGPAWQAIGTGDFTSDGFSDDILFQNKHTGQVSIWEMNGNSLIGGGPISANPGTSWHVIGTNGGSDILLQNTSGQTSIWDMSGNTLVGGGPVSPNPGSSWRAVDLT